MPQHSPGLLSEVLARTVVSAWFFGGLLMLAALMRALWKLVAVGQSAIDHTQVAMPGHSNAWSDATAPLHAAPGRCSCCSAPSS